MKAIRKRGMTLVELLIASLLGLLVASALLVIVQTTYTAQDTLFGQNAAYARIREGVDRLADNIRMSQLYPAHNATGAALIDASRNELTIYTDSSGNNKIRFYLDTSASPPALTKVLILSSDTTPYNLVNGVDSLVFTYYMQGGSTFTATNSSWTTTADPNQPTAVELPNVGAVRITASVNVDGYVRNLSTFVRMRNSPYKTRN